MGLRTERRLVAIEKRITDPSRQFAERHRRLRALMDDRERVAQIAAELTDPDGETAPERFLDALGTEVGIGADEPVDGRSLCLIYDIARQTPYMRLFEQQERAKAAAEYARQTAEGSLAEDV